MSDVVQHRGGEIADEDDFGGAIDADAAFNVIIGGRLVVIVACEFGDGGFGGGGVHSGNAHVHFVFFVGEVDPSTEDVVTEAEFVVLEVGASGVDGGEVARGIFAVVFLVVDGDGVAGVSKNMKVAFKLGEDEATHLYVVEGTIHRDALVFDGEVESKEFAHFGHVVCEGRIIFSRDA